MDNYDLSYRIKEFTSELKNLRNEVIEIREGIGINEFWDNADMIRNWKVSTRTLATWRAEGIIGYVQVGSKIWYPAEARENFIKLNYIKTKRGGQENEG